MINLTNKVRFFPSLSRYGLPKLKTSVPRLVVVTRKRDDFIYRPFSQVGFEADVGPSGNLFSAAIDSTLLHKTASICRIFYPHSNAKVMLTCGGRDLAAHASFDPKYDRAKNYIRNHSVGPTKLSPVLLSGLIGALVEAALPRGIMISHSMKQIKPLIVGVEIEANIKVTSVVSNKKKNVSTENHNISGSHGYELTLQTKVNRVRDGKVISEGSHDIWVPDYSHM